MAAPTCRNVCSMLPTRFRRALAALLASLCLVGLPTQRAAAADIRLVGGDREIVIQSQQLDAAFAGRPAPAGLAYLTLGIAVLPIAGQPLNGFDLGLTSHLEDADGFIYLPEPLTPEGGQSFIGPRDIAAGEPSYGQLVFLVPADGVALNFIHDASLDERLSARLDGSGGSAELPANLLAGPVTMAGLEVGVESFAPGAGGAAATLAVVVTNRSDGDIRANVGTFVMLVEGGRFGYPLAGAKGVGFAEDGIFPPGAPRKGELSFDVPASAGRLSLIVFTADGVIDLLFTPERPVRNDPVIAGPVASSALSATLRGWTPASALASPQPGSHYAEASIDVALASTTNMTSVDFGAGFVSLLTADGKAFPAETSAGLAHPLGRVPIWVGQPQGGEVAFLVPDGTSLAGAAVQISGTDPPIRLPVDGVGTGGEVVPAPSLSLRFEAGEVGAGKPIAVLFDGYPGNNEDWLSIAEAGSADDKYLQAISLQGARTGRVVFNSLGAGKYELRAYFNWPDNGYRVEKRIAFEVVARMAGPAGSLVKAARAEVRQGDPVTLIWQDFPGFDGDWIAIFRQGDAENADPLDYLTLHGKTAGRQVFDGRLKPGDYETRAYFNGERIVQDRFAFKVRPRSLVEPLRDDGAINGLTNVALRERSSFVEIGGGQDVLGDGNTLDYDLTTGFAVLDPASANRVWLAHPFAVDRLRFLLWDVEPRYYRFRVEATADGVSWQPIADHSSDAVAGGWQDIALDGRQLIAFRFTDLSVDGDDSAFRVVEFAAYTRETVPVADVGTLPAGDLPPWTDRPTPQPLNVAVQALRASVDAPSGPRYAIDGIHDEKAAATAAVGQYIAVKLEQAFALDRVRLDLGSRRGISFRYRIEGTSDGVSWTTIVDRSDTFHSGIEELSIGNVSVAALRVVPVELKGSDSLSIVELEAFATGAMPVTALATPLPNRIATAGRNLALAINGGKAAATSEEHTILAPIHLIDGRINPSWQDVGDWRAAETNFPEEVVIAFGAGKDVPIDAVDVYSGSFGSPPRIVDVAVASQGSGWTVLGRFGLDDRPAQRISFAPVEANAVRLRIAAGYSEHRLAIGEIVVREAVPDGGESTLPSHWPGFEGGLNVGAATLGGLVLASGSFDTDPNYDASKLNDGFAATGGWAFNNDTRTPYATFGFAGGQTALVAGLAFSSIDHSDYDQRWTSMVEIWSSTESGESGFRWLGRYRLDQANGAQIVSFKPVEARFVRVLFMDTFGSPGAVMGEVEVLEAPGGTSVTASQPPNLLDLRYGGHVAVPAGVNRSYLIDSTSATDGWYDDSGKRPVDITFGFRESQPRTFDAIGFNPRTSLDPATWARRAKVLVSDHPLRGFRLVGEYEIRPEDRLQYFSFPVETARYVKVTLLDNGGDTVMSLGDVAIREAVAPGEMSVLARLEGEAAGGGEADEEAVAPLVGDAAEQEPNDSRATANALAFGRSMTGAVDPLTDKDFFRFDTSNAATTAVNARIEEQPSLRSELTIYGTSGAVIASQPLYDVNQPSADFTWLLKQGPHDIRLAKAQNSIVFIVDRSGSVTSVRPQIASAAMAFAEYANPDEAISFAAMDSGFVYNDFTNDKDALVAAAMQTVDGSGGSGVYESLMGAMQRLAGRKGAKAIVIVTDGEDSGSSMQPLFDLWTKLGTTGVRIYTVGFGDAATNPLGDLLGSTGGDMLRNFSIATGGRFFLAPDGAAMADIYKKIAADLRSSSGYRLTLTPAEASGRLQVVASGEHISGVSAPRKVELILDASGSMKRKLEGNRTRMEVAREVLHKVVDQLPAGTEVALRVYGHRLPSKPHDRSCTDIELIVPFGPLDRDRLHGVVDAINPRGETPIGRSIVQMSGDFGDTPGRKFAILVTDGEESCDPDPDDPFYPPKVVDLIHGAGIDLTVNIVGFAIGDQTTRDFLAKLAETTGGNYYDAGSSEALTDALDAAFAADFIVQDSLGREAGRGKVGGPPIELPEGRWHVTLDSDPKIDLGTAIVRPNGTTTISLAKEGDRVDVRADVQ